MALTKVAAQLLSVFGYGAGQGGSVTQATSKSTAVTLNKPFGQIIGNGASLAANTTVTFNVANSQHAANDICVVQIVGGTISGQNYNVWAWQITGGAFNISIRNITGGSLAEGLVIHFAIIKGATS